MSSGSPVVTSTSRTNRRPRPPHDDAHRATTGPQTLVRSTHTVQTHRQRRPRPLVDHPRGCAGRDGSLPRVPMGAALGDAAAARGRGGHVRGRRRSLHGDVVQGHPRRHRRPARSRPRALARRRDGRG